MRTGGGPETFEAISHTHITNLRRYLGLEPDFTVVEIGCGIGRDAIPLTEILTSGRYLGIDIIGESIAWCQAHVSRQFPHFSFHHFDVRDPIHNPAGTLDGRQVVIPAADGTVDRIFLQSVFTHLLPEMISHYCREFCRVLKSDGRVYATCFLVDDAILASARKADLTQWHLRFEHPWEEGCYVHDLQLPGSAVAYTLPRMMDLIYAAGLALARPPLPGFWSRFYQDWVDGQDVVILKKVPYGVSPL